MRAFFRPQPSRSTFIAATVVVVACGGAAAVPEVASPARGLRNLTTTDTEVAEIAVAAARWLPSGGGTKVMFAGVYMNDRKARSATDAVLRATGFTEVSGTSRGNVVECRRVNMATGASTPIPCPPSTTASAAAAMPPTYTFVAVRATADTAYVGSTTKTMGTPEHNCMTLVRAAGSWNVLRTMPLPDAQRCGK